MKKLLYAFIIGAAFVVATPALAADGTIQGTVTYASNGNPIESLTMYAQNTSSGSVEYATTGADGSYSIAVAPGTYDVTHYMYLGNVSNMYLIQQTKTVTVTSAGTVTRNFSLTKRGRFTGRVYASDGVTRVSEATIYYTHAGGSANGYGYATSTSSGVYYNIPLPDDYTDSAAGVYNVIIQKPGYFSASVSGVNLTGDERTVTRNFWLKPASTVSGVIKTASGAALSGATVTLAKSTGGTYGATTNSSGRYTVSIYDMYTTNSTAVGDYTMTVSVSGYVTKTADISIAGDDTHLTNRNLSLNKGGKITGKITKSSGSGLSGVTITADDGYGHTYSTTTGSGGKYTLSRLKPSTSYTVTATRNYYVGQKLYGVSVSAGRTTSGKNLTLPAAVKFSGSVKSKSGVPLDNAVVYLFKRNKTRSEVSDYAFTTKSDGGFTFRNVSPGDYRLKIILNGYITYNKETITLNANTTGQKYRLDKGGSIHGRVTASGKGVAGAIVEVYAPNNGKEIPYTYAVTDEKGYYLVRSLKTNTYRLKISSTKYVTQIVKANVTAGQKTGSVVALAPAGSVSGYLTDKVTGLPVSALVKIVDTVFSAWSDSNGYYVVDGIAPGARRVTVVSPYYDLPGPRNVTITIGNIAKNVNFSLAPRQ